MKSTFVKGPIIAGDVTIDNAAVKSAPYLATDSAGKIFKTTAPAGGSSGIYAVIDETRLGGWSSGGISVTVTSGNPVMTMSSNGFVNGEVTSPNVTIGNILFDVPYYVRFLTATTFSLYPTKTQALAAAGDLTGRITPTASQATTWLNFESNPILSASGIDSVIPRNGAGDFYADLTEDKPNAFYPILMMPALQVTPTLRQIVSVTAAGFSWLNSPTNPRMTVFCP